MDTFCLVLTGEYAYPDAGAVEARRWRISRARAAYASAPFDFGS